MNKEKMKRIKEAELRQEEICEDQFNIWFQEKEDSLIEEYLDTLPAEEQPLDDDLCDFIANNDNFHKYCEEQFNKSENYSETFI